jgi:hypothetical protein
MDISGWHLTEGISFIELVHGLGGEAGSPLCVELFVRFGRIFYRWFNIVIVVSLSNILAWPAASDRIATISSCPACGSHLVSCNIVVKQRS